MARSEWEEGLSPPKRIRYQETDRKLKAVR